MSPSNARDVMLAVFLSAWTVAGCDAARVVWDDKPSTVPDGSDPWARATIKHGKAPMRAFGDGRALYDNTGILIIQVFTAVGDANVRAYDLAFAVVSAYRNAVNEGVVYRSPYLKEVGISGAFEQTNVLTDFSYID